MPLERLQKIIAAAGICSRRAAEELITGGRVRVNGPAVTELGAKADPEKDEILVDGKPLRRATPHVYIMLNKPRGCVTTVEDPEGRPTVMQYVKPIKERIYPVGRLDFHSEGLLLFTNDGEFANRILSSGVGIDKTYWVKVHGTPTPEALQKLSEGVMLDGRLTLPVEIRALPSQGSGENWRETRARDKGKAGPRSRRITPHEDHDDHDDGNPWFEVVLQEGRQNQIRRMFEMIGHSVRKLRRVRIGRLSLGSLKPGEFRHLLPGELRQLMSAEREKAMIAPRARRTAADFRKRLSHFADTTPEHEMKVAGTDSKMEASVAEDQPKQPSSEPARPVMRRPFERRPERPQQQSRFTDARSHRPPRPGFARSEGTRGSRNPRFDKRPPTGERPGERPSERHGERRQGGQPFARQGQQRGDYTKQKQGRPFDPRPRSGAPTREGGQRFHQPFGKEGRAGGGPYRRDERSSARPQGPPRGGPPRKHGSPPERPPQVRTGESRPQDGRPFGRRPFTPSAFEQRPGHPRSGGLKPSSGPKPFRGKPRTGPPLREARPHRPTVERPGPHRGNPLQGRAQRPPREHDDRS